MQTTSIPHDAIAAALRTLHEEAAAIANLAKVMATDTQLAQAIELVQNLKGRLIVTGVGKSGHVGGKIAATMASTGTPAFFVHPTEALHGDLGMITKDDAVLALSHSGESKELAVIIDYCSRFAIPLLALTGKPSSTLGKAATYVLNTHVEKEACPLNLAPTTSTTAALALADALAVGLMTARGFGKLDFAVFHPGGKLGAQLRKVASLMITSNLPLLPTTAKMDAVIIELTQKNLSCVGFTDSDGKLVGVFTDGDLKRSLSPDLFSKTGAEIMSHNPKTITADKLATAGVQQMQEHKIKTLWVTDEHGKPQGLFRLDECLAAGVV